MIHLDDTGAVHREKYTCEDQAERNRDGTRAKSHSLYLDFENKAAGDETHGIFGQSRRGTGERRKS